MSQLGLIEEVLIRYGTFSGEWAFVSLRLFLRVYGLVIGNFTIKMTVEGT